MASNTSKTARASVRAGQATGGALSVLGEFKYVIPLNGGKNAYVRNLTNGKTNHLRTDSDAFVEEIRVLAAAGHGAEDPRRVRGAGRGAPEPRLGRDREAPGRRRRLRDRLTVADDPGPTDPWTVVRTDRRGWCHRRWTRCIHWHGAASPRGGPMLGIDEWLGSLPPLTIFLVVGGIILLESMGIPLPGEITLISASLLAATGAINIWGVAIAASIGAIVGDSIGYAIGRRGGRPLLEKFGRRFPKHFGPSHLARAERHLRQVGRVGGILRPVRGAAAHPGRSARRRPARAVPQVPDRQRDRRHRLGFGHRVRDLLRRPRRREVPQGLLLDRAGRRHRHRHRHHDLPSPPGRPGGRAPERRRPDHQPVPAAEIAAIAVHSATMPPHRRRRAKAVEPPRPGNASHATAPVDAGPPRASAGAPGRPQAQAGTRSAHRPPKPRRG